MFSGSVPSLADIAAVTGNNGNNGGFGDGNGWWVLIILFALFGGWGRGYGNGNDNNGGGSGMNYIPYMMNGVWGNGALTRADLCQDMNFQNVQNGVREISSGLSTGFANLNSTICNQQYDTARMVNGLENTIQGGFNASNIVALQNQNALQTQLAQCCCDQKSLAAQAEYNRASDTCAITNAINQAAQNIIQNDNCNYRQLHDEQVALQIQGYKDTIAQQNNVINSLNLAQSQANQNNYLISQLRPQPVPAFAVPNPFNYNWGNSCGCGCNNPCGSNAFGF